MASYRLTLFGYPLLFGPAGTVRMGARKTQALFLFLAANGGTRFARPHLASLLWGDQPDDQALGNLRLALHRLRAMMPVWPIKVTHDALGWEPSREVEVDLDRWRQLLHQGDSASLAAAVALRQGPLLDGFEVPGSHGFADWVAAERQRCDEQVLGALERLVQISGESRSWQQSAGYARQALTIDPLRERYHRHLMLSCYQAGEQAAARAAYAHCQQILREELGVEPDPATQALYTEISAGRAPRLPARTTVPGPLEFSSRQAVPVPLPLVGRESELKAAGEMMRDAHQGRVRVLLISGEAGIGKSRLLAELIGAAAGAPGTVLVGSCHQGTDTLPFAPITFALRQQAPQLKRWESKLPVAWRGAVTRLLPELAEGRSRVKVGVRTASAEDRVHLLEGIAQLLLVLPPPVTLCIEDLHWSDEATLQLLGYLARRTHGPALALVVTCRPGEESAAARHLLTALEREGTLGRVDLGPLSSGAIGELVKACTGAENSALAERLMAESQGNAFYATELLRAVQLPGTGCSDPEDSARLPLPRTVQGVIQQRLERLPPLARELIAVMAIRRRAADLDLLAAFAGMTLAETIPALESALVAGIVTQVNHPAEAHGHRRATYSLHHDLVRRVVVESLSAPRLASLHRSAYARVLDQSRADVDRVGQRGGPALDLAEELAAHALNGELWEAAEAWYQASAKAAIQIFAYPEASRFLERALSCLERLAPTPARTQAALDIRLRLGEMRDLFLPRSVERWLAPVAEDAQALGDESRSAAAKLAQAQLLIARGQMDEATQMLHRLLPVAQSEELKAKALALLGTVCTMKGEYLPSLAYFREAIPLFGDSGVQHILYRQARSSLIWVLVFTGEFDIAIAEADNLLTECRQWGDPAGVAQATTAMANALNTRGHWQEALPFSQEGMQVAQKAEHRFYAYVNTMLAGAALTQLGEVHAGIKALEQALELCHKEGVGVLQDVLFLFLAEGHVAAGRFEEAEQAALQGRRIAEARGTQCYVYRANRILGQICSLTSKTEEAHRLLSEALTGFQGLGARPDEARCHASLAKVALTQADRETHARTAVHMFQKMGMDWDTRRLRLSQGQALTLKSVGH